MAATVYDDQRDYIKFLKKKAMHEEHGHGECDECKDKGSDFCDCCPPGLVAVYDDQNSKLGCLSPNDAELYRKNTFLCQDGYLKLVRIADGAFFGCVSEENFQQIYDNINGLSS